MVKKYLITLRKQKKHPSGQADPALVVNIIIEAQPWFFLDVLSLLNNWFTTTAFQKNYSIFFSTRFGN